MTGPFVHDIDPVITQVGPFYLWWYGLSYTLGFLGLFFWLKRNRQPLSMNMGQVYDLCLYMALGVLLGGRLVEVIFYEWAYYSSHLLHIPAIWLGGMSTHGILAGGIAGMLLFCRRHQRNFFEIGDVVAIAAAYIMGVGRIGNFIDGQIVGSITQGWWGVKFPDLEGYRHPVVLYDGLKNLLLVPVLMLIRRAHPPRGVIVAHFILWYGFLRIFVDMFREYRTDFLGFPPGQEFNIGMTLVGLALLINFHRRPFCGDTEGRQGHGDRGGWSARVRSLWPRRIALTALLLLPTVIPSDWTQDVPSRYGGRHPGMHYSAIYPAIDTPVTDQSAASGEMGHAENLILGLETGDGDARISKFQALPEDGR